jgi:hypothetical protein
VPEAELDGKEIMQLSSIRELPDLIEQLPKNLKATN